MKTLITLGLLLGALALAWERCGFLARVEWLDSYHQALASARKEGKQVLVAFTSGSCPTCVELEKGAFLSPEFERKASEFVCVRVDCARDPSIARAYGVTSVPSVCVLDADGQVCAVIQGRDGGVIAAELRALASAQ